MNQVKPILAYQDKVSESGDKVEAWQVQERSLFGRTCPYCKSSCHVYSDETSFDIAFQQDTLAVCMRCGWWSFQSDQSCDLNGEAHFFSARAILKRFAIGDLDVPFVELSRYVSKNPDKLGTVDPVKFEELVASVYRDVLGYTIEFCSYGRPDLGIDVICIRTETNEVHAIQAKRYNRPIELGLVHQFTGALIDSGYASGTLITSGNFRSGSYKAVQRIEEKANIKIDLVDGNQFLDFLELLNYEHNYVKCPYWQRYGYMSNLRSVDNRIRLSK